MAFMTLLEEVKQDLRIRHNKVDECIQEDIQSALELIHTSGVRPDTSDKLVRRAVKFYLRYINDFDEKGTEYKKAFDNLLGTMMMSSKRQINEE